MMRLRVLAVLVFLLGASSRAALASAPSVGIYFDPDFTTCSTQVTTLFVPFTFYIVARLQAPVAGGISGFEFRVDGLPEGWNLLYAPAVAIPNPAISTVIGDPFRHPGVAAAFADCYGPSSNILLFTCYITPFYQAQNVRLRLMNYDWGPCNLCWLPCWYLPILTACDAPAYTTICAPGGQASINGPACTVSVETSTWSGVKLLYKP